MPKSQSFLSLIIPAYNEEYRLEACLGDTIRYCEDHFQRWEILYVDDGSTDGTYRLLSDLQIRYPNIRVIQHSENQGKGKAVRTGFAAAEGDLLLFSDVDFSTPIEDLGKLLQAIEDGFDIAIGSRALPDSRIVRRQSRLRETLGKAGNLLIRSMLYLPIYDTQCGFKLFRKEAARQLLPRLTIDGFAFDVEMLTVATLMGFRICEIAVTWKDVQYSKVRPIHSLQVLRDVFTIRFQVAMGKYL